MKIEDKATHLTKADFKLEIHSLPLKLQKLKAYLQQAHCPVGVCDLEKSSEPGNEAYYRS